VNVGTPNPPQGPVGMLLYNAEEVACRRTAGSRRTAPATTWGCASFFGRHLTNRREARLWQQRHADGDAPGGSLPLLTTWYPQPPATAVKWIDEIRGLPGRLYRCPRNTVVKSLVDPAPRPHVTPTIPLPWFLPLTSLAGGCDPCPAGDEACRCAASLPARRRPSAA